MQAKALLLHVEDNCDDAGVWVVDRPGAEFQIGSELDWDKVTREISPEIQELDGGRKWFLRDFLCVQYGTLSPRCNRHTPVFRLLAQHGIQPSMPEYMPKPPEPLANDAGPSISPPREEPEATIPTLDEFKALAGTIALPDSEVEACYYHYAAAHFLRGNTRLSNYRYLLSSWKINANRFRTPKTGGGNGTAPRERWKIEEDIESVKRERERFQNDFKRRYRGAFGSDWLDNLRKAVEAGTVQAQTDLADYERNKARRAELETELKHA